MYRKSISKVLGLFALDEIIRIGKILQTSTMIYFVSALASEITKIQILELFSYSLLFSMLFTIVKR